jgi:hypothetical protein
MHVVGQHNAPALLSRKRALIAIGERLDGPEGHSGHGHKEKYPALDGNQTGFSSL